MAGAWRTHDVSALPTLAAECLGTGLLVATVVGSGIMGEKLAGGNIALALLGNTLPTGAILVVLILALGSDFRRAFQPGRIARHGLAEGASVAGISPYAAAQIVGGCLGTLVAHGMFELPLLELAVKARTGPAQWFAEFVATFGLIVTILAVSCFRSEAIPVAVGLYITAAYWFTASTSFANPAVTIARALDRQLCRYRVRRRADVHRRATVWRIGGPRRDALVLQRGGGSCGDSRCETHAVTDLPNLDGALLKPPDKVGSNRASGGRMPPRSLLYGSLRERSFSRFLTCEAERLLHYLGAETRVFDPHGLPLPDDAPATASEGRGIARAIRLVGRAGLDEPRTARRDDGHHESANRLDSSGSRRRASDAGEDACRDAGQRRLAILQCREPASRAGPLDAHADDPEPILGRQGVRTVRRCWPDETVDLLRARRRRHGRA